MPHIVNQPANPNEGPAGLPTPSLPGSNTPASPGEGPAGLPTPSLPSQPSIPVPPIVIQPVQRCPLDYNPGTVLDGQSYADLLIQNDISWNAMRAVNPGINPLRPVAGTPYCAPPAGSRRLCPTGASSYVMNSGDTLYSIARENGISVQRLLQVNSSLAPSDFIPGRVICMPYQ